MPVLMLAAVRPSIHPFHATIHPGVGQAIPPDFIWTNSRGMRGKREYVLYQRGQGLRNHRFEMLMGL